MTRQAGTLPARMRGRRAAARLLVLALAALWGCGGPAPHAAPSASHAAERLYREGEAAMAAGRTAEALDAFREGLEAARAAKNKEAEAASLHAIALAHVRRRDWGEARGALEQSLALDREAVRQARKKAFPREEVELLEAKVAADLSDLARLDTRLGEPRKALARLGELLEVDERRSAKRGQAITHNNIGRIHLALNEFDEAERHFDEALRMFEQLGDPVRAQAVRRNLEFLGRLRHRSDSGR